jgi:hypothetical protein
MEWLTFVVVDPVKAMFVKIFGYVPSLAGAIVILVVGWLVAKLIEAVIVRLLKAIRLDAVSDKAGITAVLAKGDIKVSLSDIIGALIYWIVVLVVIATALSALNLGIAADLITRLVEYVPSILAAIFILVVGALLGNFVATVVRTAASNAGISNAKILAQITQIVIVIMSFIIAIEQLKIATTLIILSINIILMSIGLGLAIAFGLGCKDMVGKMVQDAVNKVKK